MAPLIQTHCGPPSLTRMKHHRLVHRVDAGGHFSSVEDMLTNQQTAYIFFPEDMKSGFVCESVM